jgi:cytoplasmic iron level regulating protein YaaA (DUF328/UPF0246 family)
MQGEYMKIILSPSKTQDFSKALGVGSEKSKYDYISKEIYAYLNTLNLSDIMRVYKISEKLALEVESMISSYESSDYSEAISAYTGSVYREIKVDSYSLSQLEFLQNHVRILSSFYGVLKPLDLIKPYRLDMKTELKELDLKKIWSDLYSEDFKDEDLIINLASKEFSSLIKRDFTNIEFKDYNGEKYIVKATYAKMARGKMVNEIVRKSYDKVDDIKKIVVDNYKYNRTLSSELNLIFTRGEC